MNRSWPVRIFPQRTPYLCWEACGHMMWHYRYYGNDAGYAAAARSYLTIDRGLLPAELNIYYVGCLGLSSLHRPSGSDLRRLLQSGPVVFFSASATGDHAMVAAGWNRGANHYEVANPFAGTTFNFDGQNQLASFASVGRLEFRSTSRVESALGDYVWYWR
jgi:Papain-like cysteine protease AvrRpt2